MKIIVLLKMTIDVVDEIEISGDGKSVDKEWIRMKLNESDEHALEQALLIKEKIGGTLTAIAIDAPEVEDVLYDAIAKGADKAVKINGDVDELSPPGMAKLFSNCIRQIAGEPDLQTLILCGTQAPDDLYGEIAYFVGEELNVNCNGVITHAQVEADGNKVTFYKEFSGGVRGEYEMLLPAILGIQAAEKPPRYVPIAKIRMARKSANIEEIEISVDDLPPGLTVDKMFKPEETGRAEMIDGEPEEVSAKLIQLFNERGIF